MSRSIEEKFAENGSNFHMQCIRYSIFEILKLPLAVAVITNIFTRKGRRQTSIKQQALIPLYVVVTRL